MRAENKYARAGAKCAILEGGENFILLTEETVTEQSSEIVFKGIKIKTDPWPARNELEKDIFYMINPEVLDSKHSLNRVLQYFLKETKND